MLARSALACVIAAIHALLVTAAAPTWAAPALAGSVYLPLMLMDGVGLAVLGRVESGGWAAPSLLGWVLVGLLWLTIWWGAVGLLFRILVRSGLMRRH